MKTQDHELRQSKPAKDNEANYAIGIRKSRSFFLCKKHWTYDEDEKNQARYQLRKHIECTT